MSGAESSDRRSGDEISVLQPFDLKQAIKVPRTVATVFYRVKAEADSNPWTEEQKQRLGYTNEAVSTEVLDLVRFIADYE